MIKFVDGDLTEATEDIIGHSVNCMGKMNSGVAKSIREKFPEAYSRYVSVYYHYREFKSLDMLLGKCQIIRIASDDENPKYICNMFSQFYYGYDSKQYTKLEYLEICLKDLRKRAEYHEFSVALPYGLASVRGGAKWEDVLEIIERVFDGYEVTLYRWDRG